MIKAIMKELQIDSGAVEIGHNVTTLFCTKIRHQAIR
jgi:hypothetical protein